LGVLVCWRPPSVTLGQCFRLELGGTQSPRADHDAAGACNSRGGTLEERSGAESVASTGHSLGSSTNGKRPAAAPVAVSHELFPLWSYKSPETVTEANPSSRLSGCTPHTIQLWLHCATLADLTMN
jgi:hypothetical protein